MRKAEFGKRKEYTGCSVINLSQKDDFFYRYLFDMKISM